MMRMLITVGDDCWPSELLAVRGLERNNLKLTYSIIIIHHHLSSTLSIEYQLNHVCTFM